MAWSNHDQQAVRELFDRYLAAWNDARDPKACAELYASEGDLLAADGEFLRSPEQIERYYTERLGGAYESLRVGEIEIISLRSIAPDVGILDAKWVGFRVDSAGKRTETLATLMGSFVAVRNGADWRLSAVRIMVPWAPPGEGA